MIPAHIWQPLAFGIFVSISTPLQARGQPISDLDDHFNHCRYRHHGSLD